MATENTLSQQLLDLLATRDLHPEMLDRSGRPTDAPDAKTFTFDYKSSSGKNYGTMVIVLDSDNEMKLMYGDNLGRTMEGTDKNEFFDFIQHLSTKATMNRWTHTIADISQLKHTMQGLAAIQEGLFEGYYGNRNISYAGAPTQARLKIKHSQPLGENDARFRHVESLFVETADGECFRLGFRNLSGGRAMLEHVRQGGKPYDIRGCHLTEMVSEIATLSRFNRASAGRVLEGVTQEVVSQAQVYYKQLRENLKRMSTARGYSKYFESWHPADITEQEELVENIKTLFVEQTIDTRIEQALPLLAKIQQGHDMKEAEIFESWINHLAEGTWTVPETPEQLDKLKTLMASELIVGPDAVNATEQLYDLVGDDILFDRLRELAAQDPRANCWNDTEVINRLAELGIQMPEPSEPGNPAEPATAPAVPAAPVAEDSVLDRARQRVHAQGFTDSPEERTAARQQANQRHQEKLDKMHQDFIGGGASLYGDEERAHQSQQRMARDAYDTQRRKDDDEDTRKTFDMMRDRLNRMQYSNQRNVDPEQLAKISAIKYVPIRESAAPGVDAKGRTQSQWIQMVKAKFPKGGPVTVVKLIQAKMLDGPVQVTLSDGRKLGWSKIDEGVVLQEGRNEIATGTPDAIKAKIAELGLGPARRESTGSGGESIFVFRNPNYYVSQGQDGAWTLVHQTNTESDQQGMSEGAAQQLSVQQLATVSDEALDNAYHYGRSSPGNTFGWQANLKSAAYAKQMIDQGVTDIEAISDAIHKGWNVTAQAFVKDPMMFDDSKTMAPEKLQAKLAQREKLMTQQYAELPEEEKEKDRVVARAMLQAIRGEQGVDEGVVDAVKSGFQKVKQFGKDLKAAGKEAYDEVVPQLKQDWKHPIKTAMAESPDPLQRMQEMAGLPVSESRMIDESGETLMHILDRFKHEVAQFEQGADLNDNLYDALYDYYANSGEMPYGTMKARDGDPYEWISDRLDQELGTGNHAMRDLPEADAISTFEVMSGFDAPVAEGSCNMTAEGSYCPEHGLAECGGGMYESREGDAMLARIKSLALIK